MQEADRGIGNSNKYSLPYFWRVSNKIILILIKMAQSLSMETLLLHDLSVMTSMRHSTSTASKPHSNSPIW